MQKFIELLQNNEELNIKLKKILIELDGTNITYSEILNVAEKIIKLGNEHNLKFTVEDLLNYLEKNATQLTDEELADVAGGVNRRTIELGISSLALLSLGTGALSFFQNKDTFSPTNSNRTNITLSASNTNDTETDEAMRKRIKENVRHKGGNTNWKELFSSATDKKKTNT